MAGTNQALRLQGMLSNIANTVGEMGAASNWTAQNVRDYMAPDLDPSSEESLLKRQQWAMRNGYQDEANRLGVALGGLRQANQQKAAKGQLAQMQTTMAQLEQERQNALANLTVPGGGPPSDAQIAEVNRNFAQAAQRLSGRIAQTASGIDGSTGMEGAEALNKYKRTQDFKTILTNSGKAEWAPMAEYIDDPAVLQDIISGKLGDEYDPAAVREYKYYMSLPESERPGYLAVKRATQFVDLGGGGIGAVNPTDPTSVTTVVSSEDATSADADNEAATTTASAEATAGSRAAEEARFVLSAIDQNTEVYNQAIEAIDDGASTGVVASYLPTLRDATLMLENAVAQSGLSVIQNTTFGSLSATELKFALDSAIPTGLSGPALKDYLQKKIASQQALRKELNKFMTWRYKTVMVDGKATRPNITKSPAEYQTQVYGAESAEAPLPVERDVGNDDNFDIDLTTGLGG